MTPKEGITWEIQRGGEKIGGSNWCAVGKEGEILRIGYAAAGEGIQEKNGDLNKRLKNSRGVGGHQRKEEIQLLDLDMGQEKD